MASLLANILVTVTRGHHELSVESAAGASDQGRGDTHDQEHTKLCVESSRNASRKARVLSNYRHVLLRWAALAATNSHASTTASSSRNTQGRPTTTAHRGRRVASNSKGAADVPGTSPITPPVLLRSDLLSLKISDDVGRHLVARAARVSAGTLLLREHPYAWCLQPKLAGQLCAHCLFEIVAGTAPCSICGLEAFCSSTCAANAHRTWHGAECLDASGKPLEPTLLSLSPECRVALRAVRRFMREETTEPSITATSAVARGSWYTPSGTPFSSNCCGKLVMGFGDLQGHYAARSSRQNDFLETEAAIASVLATGNGMESEENDIRGHGSGDPLVEESPQTLAAKLISALVKVSTNAFAVSTLRSAEPAFGQVRETNHTRVAVGLYCTAALLNHSCTPNALATFSGGEMRIVATRAIEMGETVTISYGPLVSKMPSTPERRSLLRNTYFFHCGCAACNQENASVDGTINKTNPEGSNLQLQAMAPSKITEFGCVESGCDGTLLVGKGQILPTAQASERQSSPSLFLCCDRCGARLSRRLASALMEEDKEDRRLWAEVLSVIARLEEQVRMEDGLGRMSGKERGETLKTSSTAVVTSSEEIAAETATAAKGLIVQRARWRDHRLCPASMRRATAHDAHARLLAMEGDFSSAADACARALQVLTRRFAPEERELGIEYLKLAELCFNAGLVERCLVACQRARVSLDVCLASNDDQMLSLRNMQSFCAVQLRLSGR